MTLPITRQQALEVLKKFPQSDTDMNHYLESEAIMRALAEYFKENADYWGMLGLLHDVDWATTKENPSEHLSRAPEILREVGFDEEFIEIILSHGWGHEILPQWKDKQREKKIEHCLAAAETLTGIIYAYALMRGKKISDMEISGLKKKFKDRTFAGNCNRDIVKEIETTDLSLDEFFSISIKALKNIKREIGLE
ncbi:MAG: HDIG domain-containing metalloprotein [archaeon]